MNRALTEERNKRPETAPLALPMPLRKDEEGEVPTMLRDMETKHGAFYFYSTNHWYIITTQNCK